jgi:hypothetical protein
MALILLNVSYNGALDIINLLFSFLLMSSDVHLHVANAGNPWFIIAMIINGIFFLDMLANFIVNDI